MGRGSRFSCSGCGYDALVSGGDDAGMDVLTTTVSCEGCGELYDVVTGSPHAGRTTEPACPVDPAHPISRWQHPGPCPRCGSPVERLGEEVLWD